MAEEFKVTPSTIEPNLVPIGLNDSEYMSEVGLAVGATPAPNTPATTVTDPNIIPAGGGSIVRGFLKSQNGNWEINGDGSVDFKDGNFRGDITGASGIFSGTITATTGSIGGWSISANAIYFDGATDALSAGLAPADFPFYAGKKFADRATAPFRVTPDGAFVTSNITITGLQAGSSMDGQYVLANSIGSAAANLALQSWSQTSAFSITDADTVAWGSGVLTLADGTTYNISAGNTGNMTVRTYIYLDIAISTTVYQTTTTLATAVGNGKKLVATALNGTTEATYFVYDGTSKLNITGADVETKSITGAGGSTNTAATSPSTMADDDTVGSVAWTNPTTGALAVGGNYSMFDAGGALATSHYLKATNFGFTIPTGATINGIIAEVYNKSYIPGAGYAKDSAVRIVKGGSIGSTDKSIGTDYPSDYAYASYGASDNLWGETWTAEDINLSTFGVAISSVIYLASAYIDHIRITVYYSTAPTTRTVYTRVASIEGRGGYVDSGSPRTVGSNMIGTIPIGGDNQATVYPFYYGLKIATPKFRKRALKFEATGMGHVEINSVEDEDIIIYENRLPARFRTKAT